MRFEEVWFKMLQMYRQLKRSGKLFVKVKKKVENIQVENGIENCLDRAVRENKGETSNNLESKDISNRSSETFLPYKVNYTINYETDRENRSFHDTKTKCLAAEMIRDILIPVILMDVDFVFSVGRARKVIDDHKFHIFNWSSPSGGTRLSVPNKIWGIPVEYSCKAFEPSGKGIAIKDTINKYVVAELVNNCLYIHHDIFQDDDKNDSLKILWLILKKVIKNFSADFLKKQKLIFYEQEEQYKQKYAQARKSKINIKEKSDQQKLEEHRKEIRKLQKEIQRRVRIAQSLETSIIRSERNAAEDTERYITEYENISKLPGVQKVCVADQAIIVFTDNIDIDAEGSIFEMGKFRIIINTTENNTEECVRFDNLTQVGSGTGLGGYNIIHPQVDANGIPCFGNITETVGQLIGAGEYSALVQICLQFLKSVNLKDDAGRDISECWPLKKEKNERGEI